MGIILFIILVFVLFTFDLKFGGLLSKEIINLYELYEKLEKKNKKEFYVVKECYGKKIDELYHKQPEFFPLSLITNFIDMNKVSKLQSRIKDSL